MKRIIIILWITISAITLKAQTQTFTQMFDSVFQHVSRVEATTGVLYDRVLPYSGLHRFTGHNPDTADSYRFLTAYSELFEASFLKQQTTQYNIIINFKNNEI